MMTAFLVGACVAVTFTVIAHFLVWPHMKWWVGAFAIMGACALAIEYNMAGLFAAIVLGGYGMVYLTDVVIRPFIKGWREG